MDGSSLRFVKSPAAPKITITQGEALGFGLRWFTIYSRTLSAWSESCMSPSECDGFSYENRPPPFETQGERKAAATIAFRRLLAMSRESVFFFDVAAELKSHRRQNLVREISFAPRAETLEQRGTQHRHRNAFIDRSIDCPTTLARIRNAS